MGGLIRSPLGGAEPLRRRVLRRRPADERPLPGKALNDLVLANLPDRVELRPADRERRPRIGLMLGAGGVLGNAYLCGAIAALWEVTGFEPRTATALVGTSAGSVHAAYYGAGLPALFGIWRLRGGSLPDDRLRSGQRMGGDAGDVDDEASDPGEAMDIRDIFIPARHLPRIGPASKTLSLKAALRPWAYRPEVIASALMPEGMLTNAAVGRIVRRMVPSGWAAHPRTWIVALNLRTGERTVFGRPGAPRSHLDRAVRASCSIPGFYRPVRIGRDSYVDGGMHSPSNADLLAGLDLDLAVVLSPMSSLEGHAAVGFIDRYLYPLRRFASRRLHEELAVLRGEGVPTLVLQPTGRDLEVFSRNLMDPRPRRLVAETALDTTRDILTAPGAAEAVRLLRHAAAGARTG
jgi:NTE family protein